jgi:hypothetical protein
MSYDRQLDQVCQHLVVDEPLYLDNDQRTIRPMRSIASANSVRVLFNGSFDAPSQGVYLPPTVTGTRNGPFSITTGVNDVFEVQINQGAVVRTTLTAAARVPMLQLADSLSRAIPMLQFFVSGRKLGFRSAFTGRAASVRVLSTSTFATTVGIAIKEYRGIDRLPGWNLITPTGQIDDRPMRFIVFDNSLKSFGDYVEISYSTVQQECRRCGGIGIENDWRYGRSGEVTQVRDEALITQEMLKLFYTLQGSNPFHPWYGTMISEQIGKKILVGGVLQNLIAADITQAFGRWQTIKKQQEEKIGQFVSDAEYPFRLLDVNVTQSAQDPTVFFVAITVQNRSSNPIVLERGLRIPEPQDLLRATQQQGIFRQSLRGYVLTG